MLFHALSSPSVNQQSKDSNDRPTVVSELVAQLAETVAACELQLQELLQIGDQICQINRLIDVHWGSALAIALRKVISSLIEAFCVFLTGPI